MGEFFALSGGGMGASHGNAFGQVGGKSQRYDCWRDHPPSAYVQGDDAHRNHANHVLVQR